MLYLARRITPKLSSVAMLLCLTAFFGACVSVPSPADRPNAVQQNAPPTPELSTIQIPADKLGAPAAAAPALQSDCPGLDSALAQVAASPDPLEQARQSLMTVQDGRIQVVLVLSQEDTAFLQDHEVEIGTRSGTQVQAFVLPGRLCDLAKTDEVLTISPAAQAVLQ